MVLAIGVVMVLVVASIGSVSSAITFGRWRDVNPANYATAVAGDFNGVYVRNGGSGSIGAGDGWAVGGDGTDPLIAHYDGFSWQILASPIASPVLYNSAHFCTTPGAPGVGLCNPNGDGTDGWIVGEKAGSSAALYWDGAALTPVATGLAAGTALKSVFMACHSPPYGTGCPGGPAFVSGLTFAAGTNGAAGVIYQFNGNPKAIGGWTLAFTSATATVFNGIYMYVDSGGNLAGFAVGDNGIIATLFGGAWTEVVVAAGVTFRGVFVDRGNPADAWAVGDSFLGSGQIWHFVTGFWAGPVSPGATANDLNSVFLTSTSEGWIVGDAGTVLHSTTLGGSNTWLALTQPFQTAVGIGIDLFGVSFPGGGNGWSVGEEGVILHTENSGCPGVPSPCWGGSTSITESSQLNSVFEISSSDAWAGGLFDTVSGIHSLIHWDGNKWHRATVTGANPDIFGIYMLSSSEGWALGAVNPLGAAEALKWDGSSWTSQPIVGCGGGCYPTSVFMISGGTSGDGWAVGTTGEIWRYQSGSWGTVLSPTANNLNSVFISNPGNNLNAGWAVGDGGTVLKLSITGGVPTWAVVGVPGIVAQNLYSVYFKDSNHGWIVGASATIVTTTDGGATWSGGTAQVVGAPATTVLRSVYVDTYGVGAGNGDGWAVGDDGSGPTANVIFAHWDGTSWTNTPLAPPIATSPTGTEQYSVFVRGPEDGFAVGRPVNTGTLSAIFHLDPLNPPTSGGGGSTTTTTITTSSTSATSTSSTSVVTSSTTSSTATSTVETTTSSAQTSTTESSTVSETSTSSTSSGATVTVTESSSSTTTPLVLPAVPGFPVESIIAGVAIGLTALVIIRRHRKQP